MTSRDEDIYNKEYKDTPKEYHLKCIELIKNIKFKNILDIGCGNGIFLNHLYKTYSTCDLYGMDIHKYSLNKDYTFINEDFLKYQNCTKFDIVTSFGVISRLTNWENNIKKMLSFVNKDGKLIIYDCLNTIDIDSHFQFKQPDSEFIDNYYSFIYSKKSYINLAKKLNYNIEFIPFNLSFAIEKKELDRTYTKLINNKNQHYIYNDIPVDFYYIVFS